MCCLIKRQETCRKQGLAPRPPHQTPLHSESNRNQGTFTDIGLETVFPKRIFSSPRYAKIYSSCTIPLNLILPFFLLRPFSFIFSLYLISPPPPRWHRPNPPWEYTNLEVHALLDLSGIRDLPELNHSKRSKKICFIQTKLKSDQIDIFLLWYVQQHYRYRSNHSMC
jgi:hypothetical protein